MKKGQSEIFFENGKEPAKKFETFSRIINDRGSIYTVSGGFVTSRDQVRDFLKVLKKDKKIAKATHNSWACRIVYNQGIWETRSDDGETAAGDVILRELQKAEVQNCVVCVTRWFGGTKLMADRFKHLQDATRYCLKHMNQKNI